MGINPSKSKFQLVDDLNHKLLTANIKKDLTQWKNLHITNYLAKHQNLHFSVGHNIEV